MLEGRLTSIGRALVTQISGNQAGRLGRREIVVCLPEYTTREVRALNILSSRSFKKMVTQSKSGLQLVVVCANVVSAADW